MDFPPSTEAMPIESPFDNFKTDINFPFIVVINLAFPFLIKKT